MEKNEAHTHIYEKIDNFIKSEKIPNLLFHGNSGVGKKTILKYFLQQIYTTNESIVNNVLVVNCSQEKGIKFIREDLKFFSRANIIGNIIKSVVLLNAEQLTADAQSALRRCIELFSNNTRFFIIIEKKIKILKPILSRFCDIYIPNPIINGIVTNFYQYNKDTIFYNENKKKFTSLEKIINNNNKNIHDILELTNILYNKGYSANDIIFIINNNKIINLQNEEKNLIVIYFNKIREQFRNEKTLIFKILYLINMRNSDDFTNIINM
jgi:DNA polymerase III delta prime subunit